MATVEKKAKCRATTLQRSVLTEKGKGKLLPNFLGGSAFQLAKIFQNQQTGYS